MINETYKKSEQYKRIHNIHILNYKQLLIQGINENGFLL